MNAHAAPAVRHLVLVLGDQLRLDSPALAGLDPAQDRVLMIEAPGEASHVWSHRARIALFIAAMRHFRDALRAAGHVVDYVALTDAPAADDATAPAAPGAASPDAPSAAPGADSLAARLLQRLLHWRPRTLRLVEAGEWRLETAIADVAREAGVALRVLDDTHFICSRAAFARWADGHGRAWRMEFFYRHMRREHRVLMDADGQPAGGAWNYDGENRKGYPKGARGGPGLIPPPAGFEPDALTREVFADVERLFPHHPGSLASFRWPVTRAQALQALATFIDARLPGFGEHQDAMWTATPFGWHSLLSSSLNLHLLDPREVIAAAEAAWRAGDAPLAAVEGFIRQILGWREFIRGVYWQRMPQLADANHLGHHRPLPAWYWTGETQMACARDAIGQTLRHGYAHHIQRLMVTGLFALLAETEPRQVADWYLAVYVDAVEWAELPNVAGMALYADGGRFTSKPYLAGGAYINRMSNYCGACRYAPDAKAAAATNRPLCPFTVLFWHFLDGHEAELAANPRTAPMARNVARLSPPARERIRVEAADVLSRLDTL